jgi:hypothetical protein
MYIFTLFGGGFMAGMGTFSLIFSPKKDWFDLAVISFSLFLVFFAAKGILG